MCAHKRAEYTPFDCLRLCLLARGGIAEHNVAFHQHCRLATILDFGNQRFHRYAPDFGVILLGVAQFWRKVSMLDTATESKHRHVGADGKPRLFNRFVHALCQTFVCRNKHAVSLYQCFCHGKTVVNRAIVAEKLSFVRIYTVTGTNLAETFGAVLRNGKVAAAVEQIHVGAVVGNKPFANVDHQVFVVDVHIADVFVGRTPDNHAMRAIAFHLRQTFVVHTRGKQYCAVDAFNVG